MVLIGSVKASHLLEAVSRREWLRWRGYVRSSLAGLMLIAVPVAAQSQDRPPPDPAAGVAPIEPGLRGFGVRAVEGSTQQEMLSRCRQVRANGAGGNDPVAVARCDQFQRTIRNQPGNAAR
jgi:hypothetical protein